MDRAKFNPEKIKLVDITLPHTCGNSVLWKNVTHYCDHMPGRVPVFFRALRALAAFNKHPSAGVVEDLQRFTAILGPDMPFIGQNEFGEHYMVWLLKTASDTVGLSVVKVHYNGDIGLFTMTRQMFRGRGLQSAVLPRLYDLYPLQTGREVKPLLPQDDEASQKMLRLYRRPFAVGDEATLEVDITENGKTYQKGTVVTIRALYTKDVFAVGLDTPGDDLTFVAGSGSLQPFERL